MEGGTNGGHDFVPFELLGEQGFSGFGPLAFSKALMKRSPY